MASGQRRVARETMRRVASTAYGTRRRRCRRGDDVTEPSATARPQRPRLADSKATARTAPAKRATGRGARAGCGRGARAHTRRERRDDGVDAVDAAERPRERADSEAAAREASEADARPKPPQRESKRRTRVLEAATRQRHTPRETTTGKPQKKNTHRSSTSTAARSSRSARRRSSSSAGRRRACCCARTSPRGA